MTNILLDPLILLAPEAHASKEKVEQWAKTFQLWLEAIVDSPHGWYHCALLILNHFGYERLPSFKLLRDWQRRYQIEIDIPEMMRYMDALFLQETREIKPLLESRLLQLGYLFEPTPETTAIQPSLLVDRWPENVQHDMFCILALAGAGKWRGDSFSNQLALATLSLPQTPNEFAITSTMVGLVHGSEQREIILAERFPLLYSPEMVISFEGSEWKWNEHDIRRALEDHFQRDWLVQGIHALPFQFGPHFFASIQRYGLETDLALLSKIAYLASAILADRAMDLKCNLRHLRESKTVDSPQRTRPSDKAKAWRTTITNKGVGWRMHHWRIPTPERSCIEFANILKKHDPEIIY